MADVKVGTLPTLASRCDTTSPSTSVPSRGERAPHARGDRAGLAALCPSCACGVPRRLLAACAPDRDDSLALPSRTVDAGVTGERGVCMDGGDVSRSAGDDGDEMERRRGADRDRVDVLPLGLARERELALPDWPGLPFTSRLLPFFVIVVVFAAFSRAEASSAVSTTAQMSRRAAPGTLEGGFSWYRTEASARDSSDSGVTGHAAGDGVLDADTKRDMARSDRRGTRGDRREVPSATGDGVTNPLSWRPSAVPRDVCHSSPNASAYAATRRSSSTPSNASSG